MSAADALDAARRVLGETFGFADFRPGQAEIVEAMIGGEDVLAIMPTGGGKSLCYQLPALAGGGLTLVVSPLIALMADQVAGLSAAGAPAAALTSSTPPEERAATQDALREGRLRLLYVAPERLASERFCDWLASLDIRRLAVDEAHCVSQWGHDFRPDYLRLGGLAERLGVPVGAFTATADEDTREEIARRLFGPRHPRVFLRGFDRPNLFLAFRPRQGQDQVVRFVERHRGSPGIVYCSTRNRTEAVAARLERAGIPAAAYHAGLEPQVRERVQAAFARADDMVICATVAFGMGVDKPDVRFVAHADLPKSIEAYYQEIGRAGRDGLPADTLTLWGIEDIRLARARIEEGDAPPERKRADHTRLQALLALAEAPRCRRETLLAYFGEVRGERCNACDLCREPVERIDGTELAQMALSAIVRTEERFGAGHIVNVLRGVEDERLTRWGHDRIRTFGVGAAHSENAWRGWLRQIYALGLTRIDPERHNAWAMTEAGWEVLRGARRVELRRADPEPERRRRGRGGQGAAPPVEVSDPGLFEALRATRRRLAEEAGVPAYIVFLDRTLVEMAEAKPRTREEMGRLYGVGTAKLDKFAEPFLEAIRAHRDDAA